MSLLYEKTSSGDSNDFGDLLEDKITNYENLELAGLLATSINHDRSAPRLSKICRPFGEKQNPRRAVPALSKRLLYGDSHARQPEPKYKAQLAHKYKRSAVVAANCLSLKRRKLAAVIYLL
jgi:hypothetical protein